MALYQGKRVSLNKVQRGGSKKFFVYVKNGNKVKKVSLDAKFKRKRGGLFWIDLVLESSIKVQR